MKFRIWNNLLGRFVIPDQYYINGCGEIFCYDKMEGVINFVKDDCIIQKFTELYDIYGKPIYEGDRVKIHFTHENIKSEDFSIRYNHGKWTLDNHDSLNRYWIDNKKWGDTCKVVIVGNIFDNNKSLY
jgi:hypothetical protein